MEDTEQYLDKLHAVFGVFDTDNRGYITVDHFVDLAREHFGADNSQDINNLVKVLDEEGDGKIHFNEFCNGVQQILTLNSSKSLEDSQTAEGLARSALRFIGSEETLVAIEDDTNSCGNTSELSTFNEYDMMTDDDGGSNVQPDIVSSPLGDIPTSPLVNSIGVPTGLLINFDDDGDSAISGQLSNGQDFRREEDVTDDEERYEYNGDGEDAADSDDVDIKPVDTINSNQLLSPFNGGGSFRRGTASALASQLYRGSPSPATGSRRSSACSDEILDDIDGSFSQLNDKVKHLESQISTLTDTQGKNDERHVRLRDENTYLVERVHILEEQLRDVDIKAQNKIHEEEKKHRELMSRTDKDKSTEIEILSQSLQHIEREYSVLKEECPRLRQEVDRLKRDNVHLEERLNETQFNLHQLTEEHSDTLERSQQQKDTAEQERLIHAQLLDELGKELQELRTYKVESEERSRLHAPSPKDIPSLHKRELENHIVRLKKKKVPTATLR